MSANLRHQLAKSLEQSDFEHSKRLAGLLVENGSVSGSLGCATGRHALAQCTNASHTKVHRYFHNKDGILRAVQEYAYGLLADALESGIDSTPKSDEMLCALAHSYSTFAENDPCAFAMLFGSWKPGRTSISANEKRVWEAVRTSIATTLDQDHYDKDTEELCQVMWGTIHGIASLSLSGNIGNEVSIEKLLRRLIDALRHQNSLGSKLK